MAKLNGVLYHVDNQDEEDLQYFQNMTYKSNKLHSEIAENNSEIENLVLIAQRTNTCKLQVTRSIKKMKILSTRPRLIQSLSNVVEIESDKENQE